jgi:hypothetical protein
MAPGEYSGSVYRRKGNLTETLAAVSSVEERHSLLQALDCPQVVTLGLVGISERLVGERLQDGIPTGRSKREGALGDGNGLVICAHAVEMDGQKARDLQWGGV